MRPYLSTIIIILSVGMLLYFKSWKASGFSHFWEQPMPYKDKIPNLIGISAKDCGACHVDNYNEWKQSIHAYAIDDLQYINETAKPNAPYVCINCHAPLENQQEWLITGLVDGDILKPIKIEDI